MHVWMHSCIVSVICFLIYIISRGSSPSYFIKKNIVRRALRSGCSSIALSSSKSSYHHQILSSQTNFNNTLQMQKKCQICDGRDTVRVASISNRQCKRCSIFAMERGNTKIELLIASPQNHNDRSQKLSSPLKTTPLGPVSLLLLHVTTW
jgi:hypothetical protein